MIKVVDKSGSGSVRARVGVWWRGLCVLCAGELCRLRGGHHRRQLNECRMSCVD